MLIAMVGPPGTGKSTLGQVIASRLNIPVVSVDPIEKAIHAAGIDPDQPTGLAAYLVAETLAERLLASGSGVVIDAVNAVTPAREQWVRLAARLSESLRFIEVICSDEEVHRQRIEAWQSIPNHQLDWNAVEESLEDYAEWTGPSAAVARIT
ncbi:MAG: ATP-binding protein, partial [Salinibacterium sp.]